VFVHGIRGDPRKTWTATQHTGGEKSKKLVRRAFPKFRGVGRSNERADVGGEESVFWPKDFLLKDVPSLRIISFGYDADVSAFLNRTSDRSIFSIAQDLVVRLEMLRDRDGHVSSLADSRD
jgi:hypothetical protein